MPLIQGKSKKSLSKNIETEMHAGKPKDQSIAIAYSIQRKNKKKKMADGGRVDISAKDEDRPMPDESHADRDEESRNSGKKELKSPNWTDDTYSEQASRSFSKSPDSVADHDFRDESEAKIDNAVTPEEMDMIREYRRKMAQGGAVEFTPSTPEPPFEDEDENRRARRQLDQEHSREALARGGEVSPQDEIDNDHESSVASAIMAKRKRMADGGMVDLEKNSEEDLNNEDQMSFKAGLKEQYDLDQLDEQPEDSNEHRDDIDSDEHDMISSIRKKLSSKRSPMTR